MNVRIVAVTKPLIANMTTACDLVAFCARVSNKANQDKHHSAGRLIGHLVRNREWSPFEMANMVVEVVTTRDIARQILRHRSFSFQEFSQRYAEVQSDPVYREARLQDVKNRQSSLEIQDPGFDAWWKDLQAEVADTAMRAYGAAINAGIAKEVARAVLPEGLTESTMYINGNIRSWIHYIALRTMPATQKEHRIIAEQCKQVFCEQFPELIDALDTAVAELQLNFAKYLEVPTATV